MPFCPPVADPELVIVLLLSKVRMPTLPPVAVPELVIVLPFPSANSAKIPLYPLIHPH